MLINQTYTHNTINFKAGLNKNIQKHIQQVNVNDIELAFSEYANDSNFNNNKFYAFGCAMALNIFEEISNKFNLPFCKIPPYIRVFQKNDLIKPDLGSSFCLVDSATILKSEQPFQIGSIFFEKTDNYQEIDKIIEMDFLKNKRSSSHFLSEIIHEWSHNIHLDLIFKKFGYEGLCPFASSMYKKTNATGIQKIQEMQNKITENHFKNNCINTLGEYSSFSKMETFAEGLTKIITSSIDTNSLKTTKNPLDDLLKMPKEIKNFLEEEIF